MEHVPRFRNIYAQLIVSFTGRSNPRLVNAFSEIEREKFLGAGPWYISPNGDMTPSDDPAFVYHDMAIGLDQKRDLTNGQPSSHAMFMNAIDLQPGERVVHLGAGSGITPRYFQSSQVRRVRSWLSR